MIEYIRGRIEQLSPTSVTIGTAGGVGYLLYITLPTFTAIQTQTETALLVHEVIREDAWTLYGFATEDERRIFRALIGVSGVGASTANIILSSLSADELAVVISTGDTKRLKAVKGIGAKTAERIIVDLRDKIKPAGDTLVKAQTMANNEAYDEAEAALLMLGFDKKSSRKALDAIFGANPATKVEVAIKQALAMM